MHEVQVDVVGLQGGEGLLDGLGDALVPGVVELGGQEDVLAWHARGLEAVADLLLVAVGKGRVDVAIPGLQRGLDGRLDGVRRGLPGPQADGGDLGTRVEGVGLSVGGERGVSGSGEADGGWGTLRGVLDGSHDPS